MENTQKEIEKFIKTRETFTINDEYGIGKCDVMILDLWHLDQNNDYHLTILDMSEFKESWDIIDYKITLEDLIKARDLYINEKEEWKQ